LLEIDAGRGYQEPQAQIFGLRRQCLRQMPVANWSQLARGQNSPVSLDHRIDSEILPRHSVLPLTGDALESECRLEELGSIPVNRASSQ